MSAAFFETRVEYLKGIGPQKAALLNTELRIFTYKDLLEHYPFRYEDRSKFHTINEITQEHLYVQLTGRFRNFSIVGEGRKKRLTAIFTDGTGSIELVWFQGIKWVAESLKTGVDYIVYGKPTLFNHKWNIAHPEATPANEAKSENKLVPVYPTTEKLKVRGLDSKGFSKILLNLIALLTNVSYETLSSEIINKYKLISKKQALRAIHFPKDYHEPELAKKRLKFDELFFIQLRLIGIRSKRKQLPGQVLKEINLLNEFYKNHLLFELTNAQKRVIKEIYKDLGSGKQMNRLVQGDVGSGKTIVAFIGMLIALDSSAQACLMAPTEILAQQHFQGLKPMADALGISIKILTGSTKIKERRLIHETLLNGKLQMLIGTHALLEDIVQFNNLGLVVIDEQHRFGVEQRARLWKKNRNTPPHILVMTATPIPRTLAMTLYGDLELSVIDELPAGRKPIKTVHRFDSDRLKVFGFIRQQLNEGRQVYIVYPLIEESEKLDLKDLQDGYESISRAFPDIPLSIVHGRMTSDAKDYEMTRFVKAETKIMVATTVIEVGVNVPNASVMVIENAERFGLSQLHQLRGRVGRGADQSYCILMTGYKLSQDSKIRIRTMVETNNGFEIADVDLRLRGPGDITGTQQSGALLSLKLTDLAHDGPIMEEARTTAEDILDKDPTLIMPEHSNIRMELIAINKNNPNWSRIS
jgi:ATP-dependent DNA helicase RecG